MSDATLIRRLAEEHTSFKEVRDAVLWETVDALLSNPSLKIEAIALSVGFADGAAFAEAMRRREGCSPSVHRARLARRLRATEPPAHRENR
jgi:AraC-like DNA-binding protein